ncbi:hypothetical protein HYX00_01155 [Candidatus Woesearchaeota archaeon]|nr:hypothetical protein [Candidatus Woesearchaeota archaeon]
MDKREAQRCLVNVRDENCFWSNDGQIIKNLAELPHALKRMKRQTFSYHVNKEKNDFATWVRDVFGDVDLADKLNKKLNKAYAIQIVKSRLAVLQKALGQ